MNTLSIILLALNYALVAVRTVDGFIADEKVSAILDTIGDALEIAIEQLAPHQRAAQEAAARGEAPPVTCPKPSTP